MFINPRALIDDTIDKLETLSAVFLEEVRERTHDPDTLTPEARACKEALLTIKVLIPKLQHARSTQGTYDAQMELRECARCD